MMRKPVFLTLIILLSILSSVLCRGQAVLFSQNFEDTASLFQGYVLSNLDHGIPVGTEWASLQDSAWVVRSIPGFNTHAAVATANYNPPKAADDWFITPAVKLGSASRLSFRSLSLTEGKADTYDIYISTTDQTVNGCLFNLPLWQYTSSQATAFEDHSLDLAAAGYADQEVYIGFRLATASGGDKIAIDDIRVTDDSLQSLASLTFIVDMSKYIALKKFHPSTDTVDVAGNFNGWIGTTSIMSLVPGSDSSRYTITIPGFRDGDHLEFKFRINSSWNDTTVEFPFGGPNRVWNIIHGKYTFTAFYNEQGTVSSIPDPTDALAGVNIFPNPVTEELTIVSTREIRRIMLLSITGHPVMEWKDTGDKRFTADTSILPPGTYILLFYNEKGLAGSRKLIRR